MTPRQCIDFFKTPSGRLLAFGLVFAASVGVFIAVRSKPHLFTEVPISRATNDPAKPQVLETVNRPMEPFRPPPPRPDPPTRQPELIRVTNLVPVAADMASTNRSSVTPISLYPGIDTPEAAHTREVYAPYGRLIPCETVITVDSSSIRTPIIGLITEDVYHAGRLVIPAGTEVHGTAQTDRSRERIASDGSWTLVWQTGEELQIRAMALDREFENSTNQVGWGITDGSAGLRGRLIKSDDLAEIKLFAATFLSGAAASLTEKETTLLGSIDRRSLNNAPLKGAEEVLSVYAQRIQDSIQRDGFYVRVPSGKQFYLYALQAIDVSEGRLTTVSADCKTDSAPQVSNTDSNPQPSTSIP